MLKRTQPERTGVSEKPPPYEGPVLLSRRAQLVVSGIALVLIAGVLVLRGFTLIALAYSFFVIVGVWLSAVDLRWRILPNRIVLPSTGVGLVLLLAATVWANPDAAAADVVGQAARTVLGGAALFVVFLVLALISPRGLGMGDVKLAALVGSFLAFESWRALLLGAAAGFIGVALVGSVLLVTRRGGRSSTVPFGPFMFLGAALVLALEP